MFELDKIHPTKVFGLDADLELGIALGKLRYDLLLTVLEGLAEELKDQSIKDRTRGRVRLADSLNETHTKVLETISALKKAVSVCKPYTDEEKRREKE